MSIQKTSIDYRPDIDGLRAFAVLSVLIFHLSPRQLPGGFVGVDIFFVISGFLISSIIYNGLKNNTFSFLDFYKRRIRRIFPSLLVVLITVLLAGYFVLLPSEYKLLGWHTFGGSVYISNFILWFESGYFDVSAVYKPLLHLWSLGIEEQFYLIWPLLIFLTIKNKLNPIIIISCLIIISFLLMAIGIKNQPTATFYSPQTRFWELFSGSLLAYFHFKYKNYPAAAGNCNHFFYLLFSHKNTPHITKHILSIIGFIILLSSIFFIDKNYFPGIKTLFPIIGAVFIILAGEDAVINKYILSNKIMVWMGLISYPLYIWHWPLISYCWILEGGKPLPIFRTSCAVLAVFFAWLTYRFVEPKLRYGSHGGIKAVCLLLAVSSVGLSGIAIYKNDGLAYRFTDQFADHTALKIEKFLPKAINNCLSAFPNWQTLSGGGQCMFEKKHGENTIALIGDSHAGHTFPGMLSIDKKNRGVVFFGGPAAAPYLDISTLTRTAKNEQEKKGFQNAYKAVRLGYEYIAQQDNITAVILGHNPTSSYTDLIDLLDPNCTDKDIIMENAMRRTFDFLIKHKKKIFVLLDNPTLPFHPKKCVSRLYEFTGVSYCKFEKSKDPKQAAKDWYKKILEKVLKDYPSIVVIDPIDRFCDDKFCYISKNGNLLYQDEHHLNTAGSIQLAPVIEEALTEKAL